MGIISSLKEMIAGTLASSADVNSNFEALRVSSNQNTTNIANLAGCFFRQPETSYMKDDVVYIPNSQFCLLCTVAGTTSSEDINYTNVSDRTTIIDGTVTWLAGFRNRVVGSALTSGSALYLGTIFSTCLLIDDSDNNCKRLLGSTIRQIDYPDFYAKVVELADKNQVGICSESDYQTSIAKYGQCGKFVLDRQNQTIKLPTITRFIAGLNNISQIGDTLQDQIQNMTGYLWSNNSANCSGVFSQSSTGEPGGGNPDYNTSGYVKYDVSKQVRTGEEVQPRHSKYPYYIVLSQSNRKGLDGRNGVDGISPTIEVKNGDNNTCFLQITDATGTKTTANLRGYTPVKGIDYFTVGDIDNIVEQVSGKVEAENILLTQKIVSSTENTSVKLELNTTLYNITPTSDMSISFDISDLIISPLEIITFELLINMADTAYNITFTDNVKWLDKNIIYTDPANYLFVFRTFNQGETWLGNLQGSF